MMTAVQLRAELFREMNPLLDSEAALKKLIKYVQKLAAKKEDPTLMTHAELVERIEEAEREYREGKTYAMLPGESFKDFRNRIGR